MRLHLLILLVASAVGAALGAWQSYRPGSLPSLVVAAGLARDDLAGLSPRRIKRLFGSPTVIRHEGEAQIWQYQSPSCTLDVFFYPEPQKLTARYAELRPNQPDPDFSEDGCLIDLRDSLSDEKSG